MKVGEVHYYPIPMYANGFCNVIVDQRGIDVVITLIAPDGKRYAEIDSFNGARGPESISFVAQVTGEYRLEIKPLGQTEDAGSYSVRTEKRNATREDKMADLARKISRATSDPESDALLAENAEFIRYDFAQILFREARSLYSVNVPRSQILFAFTQLLKIGEKLKERRVYAMAYEGMGNAYGNLSDYKAAVENLRKALFIYEEIKWKSGVGRVQFDLAGWYRRQGDVSGALAQYQKSIPNLLADNSNYLVIRAQNEIAWCYVALKDFSKAYEYFQNSLILADVQGDKVLKGITYAQLGTALMNQGRDGKALEALQAALKLAEETRTAPGINDLVFRIAALHARQGNLGQAFVHYRRSMQFAGSIGQPIRSMHALFNIGALYQRVGDDKRAVDIYERGLKLLEMHIARNRGGTRRALIADKSLTLNKLAAIRLRHGDREGAMGLYEESLKALETLTFEPEPDSRVRWVGVEGFSQMKADTHRNIGNLFSSRNDFVRAGNHFQRALALAEEAKFNPGIIQTLSDMASNSTRQGDHSKALEFALRALELNRNQGRLDERANLKSTVGNVYRNLNKTDLAAESFSEAIRISETLRSDVTSPNERASYFASLQAPYDEYIDFLMDRHLKEPGKGHDRTAFDISERRRSRALLDSLKEARADIRRGVDANLIEQENEVRNRLNNAARAQDPFAEATTPDYSAMEDIGSASAPDADIPALTAELQRIETAIRAQSPRYSALTQPQPLKAAEIETNVLDDETILLNYTLGERRSFLWAISKGSTTSYVLPPRAEIEASVKKVYAHLSDGDQAGVATSTAESDVEAAKLSRTLLGPVASKFGSKRLVIVADGVLQYLPFSTLPDPRAAESNRVPMLASNEISFVPSASVISVLRQDLGNRAAAAKSVAIFADPVFSDSDERLSPVKNDQTASTDRAFDDARVSRGLLFPTLVDPESPGEQFSVPRLPFSRFEADAVEAVAPTGTSLKAVNFAASRDNVLTSDLSKYRIIHFATHGILHSEHPELSGVVLSLVNEQGEPVNGFLRLNEIYNLNLNADLVVLSACQTALGKDIRGEGLIGLARGFMYAGSPRVVASLWKVDDVATAELMKIFYQKMLKESMRPAAAPRAAKIEMRKSKRWNSSYYWAAFELQGEWR